MRLYKLINKNVLLNNHSASADYNVIFYEMLSRIDDYLNMMIENKILNENVNFDHLVCVEYFNDDIVSDVITFNVSKLQFCGSKMVYNICNELNFIFDSVMTKLKQKKGVRNTGKLQHVESKIISLGEPKVQQTDLVGCLKADEKPVMIEENKEETFDSGELLEMMETLTELKNAEEEKLESLKSDMTKEEEKITGMSNTLGDEKRAY